MVVINLVEGTEIHRTLPKFNGDLGVYYPENNSCITRYGKHPKLI